MKILAIEHERRAIPASADALLAEEAAHVWDRQKSGLVREIYFDERRCAVLVLEAATLEEARRLLARFPLVREGLIEFECRELRPYTGLERLFGPARGGERP